MILKFVILSSLLFQFNLSHKINSKFNSLQEQLEIQQSTSSPLQDELPSTLSFNDELDQSLNGLNPLPPWFPNSLKHNSIEDNFGLDYDNILDMSSSNGDSKRKRGQVTTIADKTPYPPSNCKSSTPHSPLQLELDEFVFCLFVYIKFSLNSYKYQ